MSVNGSDVHAFSIEMRSKDSLSNVCLSNRAAEPVLIQGELGAIEDVRFQENVTLEIRGSRGVLRLDVDRKEFEEHLRKSAKAGA